MRLKIWFGLAILMIGIAASVSAEARYNFFYKLSSLSQDVDYLRTTLDEILRPAGWELIPETINISDSVGGKGMGTKNSAGGESFAPLGPNVENDNYALRVVRFSARKQAKIFSGWIYLVVARTNDKGVPKVVLSPQAKLGYTDIWKRALWQSLAYDESPASFQLEVRAADLNLKEGSQTPEADLPKWAIPRIYFPKATSEQIVSYAIQKISELLTPMNFTLIPATLEMEESVVVGSGPGFPPAMRIVEGESLTLRYLSFRAMDSKKKMHTGGITLVISKPDANQIQPNPSRLQVKDIQGQVLADLFLAAAVDMKSFPLDIRFENFGLAPVFAGFD